MRSVSFFFPFHQISIRYIIFHSTIAECTGNYYDTPGTFVYPGTHQIFGGILRYPVLQKLVKKLKCVTETYSPRRWTQNTVLLIYNSTIIYKFWHDFYTPLTQTISSVLIGLYTLHYFVHKVLSLEDSSFSSPTAENDHGGYSGGYGAAEVAQRRARCVWCLRVWERQGGAGVTGDGHAELGGAALRLVLLLLQPVWPRRRGRWRLDDGGLAICFFCFFFFFLFYDHGCTVASAVASTAVRH